MGPIVPFHIEMIKTPQKINYNTSPTHFTTSIKRLEHYSNIYNNTLLFAFKLYDTSGVIIKS